MVLKAFLDSIQTGNGEKLRGGGHAAEAFFFLSQEPPFENIICVVMKQDLVGVCRRKPHQTLLRHKTEVRFQRLFVTALGGTEQLIGKLCFGYVL